MECWSGSCDEELMQLSKSYVASSRWTYPLCRGDDLFLPFAYLPSPKSKGCLLLTSTSFQLPRCTPPRHMPAQTALFASKSTPCWLRLLWASPCSGGRVMHI